MKVSAADFARLLSPSDFTAMPWQNGRGTTHEIARAPAGAKVEKGSLWWRLSVAPVTEDGPFSSFPGLERALSLVEGRGFRIHRDGHAATNLRVGDVYVFSGSEAVTAELTHGAVKDLGVIYDPAKVRAEMTPLDFTGRGRSFRLSAREAFFYVIEGEFSFSCYPEGPEGKAKPGQVLRVGELAPGRSAERIVVLEPKGKKAAILTVELDW